MKWLRELRMPEYENVLKVKIENAMCEDERVLWEVILLLMREIDEHLKNVNVLVKDIDKYLEELRRYDKDNSRLDNL